MKKYFLVMAMMLTLSAPAFAQEADTATLEDTGATQAQDMKQERQEKREAVSTARHEKRSEVRQARQEKRAAAHKAHKAKRAHRKAASETTTTDTAQ